MRADEIDLIEGVKMGNVGFVKAIFSFGANMTGKNHNGRTALHHVNTLKDKETVCN